MVQFNHLQSNSRIFLDLIKSNQIKLEFAESKIYRYFEVLRVLYDI
jgi:uncharacterized protein YjbK